MIPIDFSGKVALVTGVGDNESFAWFISKALARPPGRRSCSRATRASSASSRASSSSRPTTADAASCPTAADFKPEKMLPCDASYDTMADVPTEVKTDRRYAKFADYSIQGTVDAVRQGVRRHRHPDPLDRVQPRDHQAAHRHEPQGLPRGDGHQRVLADQPDAGRGAAHGEPAGRRRASSA